MNINKDKILFAILAGGQSKRFGGGYKTFTKISGETILNQIVKKLKEHGCTKREFLYQNEGLTISN